jgi:hypothetical protein
MRSLFFALALMAVPLAEVAAKESKECTAEQHKADVARMTAATKDGILRADPDSGSDDITLRGCLETLGYGVDGRVQM